SGGGVSDHGAGRDLPIAPDSCLGGRGERRDSPLRSPVGLFGVLRPSDHRPRAIGLARASVAQSDPPTKPMTSGAAWISSSFPTKLGFPAVGRGSWSSLPTLLLNFIY